MGAKTNKKEMLQNNRCKKIICCKCKMYRFERRSCNSFSRITSKGRTKVTNIEYILRGYENLDKKLNKLETNIQIEEGD